MRCMSICQFIQLTLTLPVAASLDALNTGPSNLADGRSIGDTVCSPTVSDFDCCGLGWDCTGNGNSLSQDSTSKSTSPRVFTTLTFDSLTTSPSTPNPVLQTSKSLPVSPRSGAFVDQPSCSSHETCLSGAAIAGICAGGSFGIGLLVAIAYFWNMKRRERQEASRRAAEVGITGTSG